MAGLRGLLKKDAKAVRRLIDDEAAGVLCLSETKLQESHVAEVEAALDLPARWHAQWACSTEKKGYSGVAVLSRDEPEAVLVGLTEADPRHGGAHAGEGRAITCVFRDCVVVSVYVPNSGDGLKRLAYRTQEWDAALASHIANVEKKYGIVESGGADATNDDKRAVRPVLLMGDLNCAHREIDIHAPKTNLKSAGFSPEERASFQIHLLGWKGEEGNEQAENDTRGIKDSSSTLPPVYGPSDVSVTALAREQLDAAEKDAPPSAALVDLFRLRHPRAIAYSYWGYRFNLRAKNKGWRLDYALVSKQGMERVQRVFYLPNVMGSDHCPVGVDLLTR